MGSSNSSYSSDVIANNGFSNNRNFGNLSYQSQENNVSAALVAGNYRVTLIYQIPISKKNIAERLNERLDDSCGDFSGTLVAQNLVDDTMLTYTRIYSFGPLRTEALIWAQMVGEFEDTKVLSITRDWASFQALL